MKSKTEVLCACVSARACVEFLLQYLLHVYSRYLGDSMNDCSIREFLTFILDKKLRTYSTVPQ